MRPQFNQTKHPIAFVVRGTQYGAGPWAQVQPDMSDEAIGVAARRGLPLGDVSVAPERRAHERVAEVRQSESSEAARAASERVRLLEADLLNAQKAASDAVLGAEKSEKRAVAAEQIAGAKERRCQELQREVDKAVEECAKQELSHGSSEALKAERESSALLKQELEHARQVASDATKAAQRAEAAKQGLESDNRVLASGMEELARDVELAAEQIAELKQSAEHAARDAAMEIEQLKAQVAELNEQLEQATAPSRQSRKQGARVAAKD